MMPGRLVVKMLSGTEALLALKLAPEEAGAALCMAGVPQVVFLSRWADYGVDTFRLAEEQLEKRGLPDVTCNTSPIQYLHQLELLHILRARAGLMSDRRSACN